MKIILLSLVFLVSCASRPKLYHNAKLKDVGNKAAEKDIDQCIAKSDEYMESTKGKQVLKGAGGGAAIGAAMGGVLGLFHGNVGQGVVRGGAIGAAGGGASGAVSPDELKQRYVNQCLGEQGYQVLGWD